MKIFFLLFVFGILSSCISTKNRDSYSTIGKSNMGFVGQRDSYSAQSSKGKRLKFKDSYGSGSVKKSSGKGKQRDSYASSAQNSYRVKNNKDSYSSSSQNYKSSNHKDSYSSRGKLKFNLIFWRKNKSKFKEEDRYNTSRKPKKIKKKKPDLGLFKS